MPEGSHYIVGADNLGENGEPVVITQSEFMRRYRDMASIGGGMNFYGELPETYNITVNVENPLIKKMLEEKQDSCGEDLNDLSSRISEAEKTRKDILEKFAEGNTLLHQVTGLALLSNGMLKGKALADFIRNSYEVVGKAFTK